MNDSFYKRLIEEMPTAYSYNKILCDKDGIPYDYEYLEVNTAFAKRNSLKVSDFINKRVTEVLPNVKSCHFDWIRFYGDIAINGGNVEIEQYVEPLKRWYRINVYSPEKFYFITYSVDITREMLQLTEMERLIDISEELLHISEQKDNYKKIAEDFLKISEAKYAAFNLFDEDGINYTTRVITGDQDIIKKASDILGYKFEEKKWQHTVELSERIKSGTVTRFHSLKELVGNAIASPRITLLEKTFNIGEVILIKIAMDNVKLGSFILFMEKGKSFNKDTLATIYTRQLGIYIKRKRAEDALLKEKALIDAVFYSIPGMLYLYNNQNKLIRWNKKHEVLTGYSAEELSKMTLLDWYKGDEVSQKVIKEGIDRAINDGFGDAEANLQKKDGTTIPMYFTASVFNFDGKQYFTGIAIDVTERKKKEAEIFNLSYHDQLTGLYNRRFYEEELKRLDKESNLPITIVMGDVNGLKLINDSFGHVMGDKLLKKVAEIISKGSRADDIVARLSGDEFVIILPRTDDFEAKQIMKRITKLSQAEKIDSIDISISFGCGTKYSMEDNTEEIFKNAEDNMYKKKLFEGPNMRGKTIQVIINTLHEKNKREEQHSLRVSALCKNMGEALGMPESDNEIMKTAGLLHDIGKIAIDENIINKQGELTEDEYNEMKRHSEIGFRMLNTVYDMADIANYILYHHERWDGKGYPKGIKGDEIPYASRIIAIANAYDDMTSVKTYRNTISKEDAIEKLKKNAGIRFDPILVNIFIEKVLLSE